MRRIVSVIIVIVFTVAASHPCHPASFYKQTKDTYQIHLDWQAPFFNIKSPIPGPAWNIFLEDTFRKSLQAADSPGTSLNALSHLWSTLVTNAP